MGLDFEREGGSASGIDTASESTPIVLSLSSAHELVGRQEVQKLIDNLAETYPKIVEDLIPTILPLGTVQKVLQNLVAERISVRDLLSILEALAEYGLITKDPGMLTELTRQAISRYVVQPYINDNNELHIISLSTDLERVLSECTQQTDSGNYIVLDPKQASLLVDRLQGAIQSSAFAIQPILMVNPNLRLPLRNLIGKVLPQLVLLSQSEIPAHVNVITVGVVGDL